MKKSLEISVFNFFSLICVSYMRWCSNNAFWCSVPIFGLADSNNTFKICNIIFLDLSCYIWMMYWLNPPDNGGNDKFIPFFTCKCVATLFFSCKYVATYFRKMKPEVKFCLVFIRNQFSCFYCLALSMVLVSPLSLGPFFCTWILAHLVSKIYC